MQEMTIVILKNSDGEYEFNIHNSIDFDSELPAPMDGGICTSTMLNAIDMACDQAKDIVKRTDKEGAK